MGISYTYRSIQRTRLVMATFSTDMDLGLNDSGMGPDQFRSGMGLQQSFKIKNGSMLGINPIPKYILGLGSGAQNIY